MSNSSSVLYVGAIPYNWDVEVIKSVVCGSGPVVDVRCMMDNASKNKGFCFVEYLSPLDALNALTILSKLKIEGRKKLRIELSKEGLRNSLHLSKPVLKLNRLLLPANVILPQEMKDNVQGLGLENINDQNEPNTISMKDQDIDLDDDIKSLKLSIINNTDIRTMVSQMLANGMDLHQIASLITQFNAKNDANKSNTNNLNTNTPNNNNNNNNSHNNPNNNINNNNNKSNVNNMMNMPSGMNGMPGGMNFGMNGMNMNMNFGMQPPLPRNNSTTNNNNNNNNSNNNNRLLNASNFLPQPTPSMQSILQSNDPTKSNTADPVSKTLSTIPPGVLIELLAKLKLVLSTPQPSASTYSDAAAILNENPKLAVAAAQALLLMGVVDLDVISQANSLPTATSSSANNNNNPATVTPIISPPAVGNPMANNIPPEWLSLPQHTVAKLLQLNSHEASLIFQVLQLSPEQIAILPLNERNMANQIRSQYL